MRKAFASLPVVALFALISTLALFAAARPTHHRATRFQAAAQAQTQSKTPAAQTPAAPPAYVIPPEAAKRVNPVKATSESIAAGKEFYGYDCAMCHGATGDGKGDLASDMKLQLKDFRDAATLKGYTDGEIFYIIQKGKGQMTGEGNRQPANNIWNMVNYLRSLARKSAAPAAK